MGEVNVVLSEIDLEAVRDELETTLNLRLLEANLLEKIEEEIINMIKFYNHGRKKYRDGTKTCGVALQVHDG